MKIAVVGGKLQGIEACYLAKRAGYETVLIDSNGAVPARGLADSFVEADVCAGDPDAIRAMVDADLVLPTNENDRLLASIVDICRNEDLKLAFDPKAYAVTSSKAASDMMFAENGVPCPKYFPEGRAPFIAKPSEGSGSSGVTLLDTRRQAEGHRRTHPGHIIQEFVSGPSYSIEVIGRPGEYRTYAVTQIHVDEGYDCYRVTCPVDLPGEAQKDLADIAVKLAGLVELTGIMDVEVIYDGSGLRVLEIDARLPSQTPAAVLESTGVNLLEELVDVTINGRFTGASGGRYPPEKEAYACYEHFVRRNGKVFQTGEHCMARAGELTMRDDPTETGTMISDYSDEGSDFSGIFIKSADTACEVEAWRDTLLHKLKG